MPNPSFHRNCAKSRAVPVNSNVSRQTMPGGVCRLCERETALQESHVIPAFVFRWMRETSGGGYLRTGKQPNVRVQDGAKYYWMCAECEGRLNRYETQFANAIFYPYCGEQKHRLRYGRWMLLFCISVSWRILRMYREQASFASWSPEAIARLDEAECTWKAVLLGKRSHPGEFEQHFLPIDAIETVKGPNLPPNINRYLLRATDTDVAHSQSMEFVYCKFGHFVLVGFVRCGRREWWRGTKIHANEGILEPQNYRLPNVFFEYILSRARQAIEILEEISPRQRDKIEATLRANIDRFAQSDLMKATEHDVRMFGKAAFSEYGKDN